MPKISKEKRKRLSNKKKKTIIRNNIKKLQDKKNDKEQLMFLWKKTQSSLDKVIKKKIFKKNKVNRIKAKLQKAMPH